MEREHTVTHSHTVGSKTSLEHSLTHVMLILCCYEGGDGVMVW